MIKDSTIHDEESLNKLYTRISAIAESGKSTPKIWREVANLAIRYNPRIKNDVICCIAEAKEAREFNMDVYGNSKTKSMRAAMKFPLSLLMLIEVVDPELTKTNQGVEKLYRAFPEFAASAKM